MRQSGEKAHAPRGKENFIRLIINTIENTVEDRSSVRTLINTARLARRGDRSLLALVGREDIWRKLDGVSPVTVTARGEKKRVETSKTLTRDERKTT